MPSSLWKDTLREIRKTKGRFFSIFAIVALGVAFFAGVKASVPDMEHTADAYFDEYNLMDIRLVSTVGFTDEDVDAIRKVDGVEGVDATHTLEALTMVGTHQITLKIHAIPTVNPDSTDINYINQANLQEGRMPENSKECLIEVVQLRDSGFTIGDTITLTSGTDTDIRDSLKNNEYTIVGTTLSPNYLSYEKGTSTIGKGKIDNYIMILEDEFKSEYYTEVNVTAKGVKEFNSYSDAYFEITDKVKTVLEDVGVTRSEIRFEEIKTLAYEKYDEGVVSYEDGVTKFQEGIATAKSTLEKAKKELANGEATLATEKQNYETQIGETRAKLDDAKLQLATGRETYTQKKSEFDQKKPELDAQIRELNTKLSDVKQQVKNLDTQIEGIVQLLKDPTLSEEKRNEWNQQLEVLRQYKQEAQTAMTSIQSGIDQIQSEVSNAQTQLSKTDEMLQDSQRQLLDGEAALEEAKTTAQVQFTKAEQDLTNARVQLSEGQAELAIEETKGQLELNDAKASLDKAKEDIENLSQPKWYVLDRESHYSYMDYGSVAQRMDAISKVFPVFFFIVAALVCLTTMTRMVEEQRSMIGTMKALGYGKSAISFKYVFYAFIASVLGSIVGCLIGMYLFPMVIFNAWALMYNLPKIQYVMQPGLAFSSSFIVIAITILAAYMAVYKELIEVPSQLMRPKAPKVGKKILLERMPLVWKHFSFTQKVTARNIFRYKKRFFMTVIGISGCTALLVAGFGIRDSIGEVVTKQYGDIMQYDVSLNYEKDTSDAQKETISNELKQNPDFESLLTIGQYNGSAYQDNNNDAITIIVPSDVNEFKNFVSLHTRVGRKAVDLPNDSILISEKISTLRKLSKGDTLKIDNGDGVQREVLIGGIVENYIGHYVYMSPSYYKDIFHEQQNDTTVLAKLTQVDASVEETIGNQMMQYDQFSSVTFYSGIAESFQETISSLSFVVVVLIIAAGMLAFVVLYNLTNVNISERIREIATIKVLGFYDKEVSAYVYRENIFLTIIGAGCGLLLGVGLHRLIMNLAEMDTLMFGRNITWISFTLSFMITLLFAIIVNLVMYRKLKEVPMVESLKSVE